MKTEILKINKDKPEKELISFAAELLKKGELVAFPTETVYGLGALATNSIAVKKIFAAKGRPQDNPLIAHISEPEMVKEYVQIIPDKALMLMEIFSPGPISVILQHNSKLANEVSAGLSTIAFRIPDNKIVLEIINEIGVPIAAPSANSSGKPSPTKAEHVLEDLTGKIPLILDGGETNIGIESTVIDMTQDIPVILRPGKISSEDIQNVIGEVQFNHSLINHEKPASPGMKYKHYSPSAKVILYNEIEKVLENAQRDDGVILLDTNLNLPLNNVITFRSLDEYAAKLYDTFRFMDKRGCKNIFAPIPDHMGIGSALLNRLKKSAGCE